MSKEFIELGERYIKNNYTLGLLNIIFEIGQYIEDLDELDRAFKIKGVEQIFGRMQKAVYELKEVMELGIDKREEKKEIIKKDLQTLLEIIRNLCLKYKFAEIVENQYTDYHKLVQEDFEEYEQNDTSYIFEDIEQFLEEAESKNQVGLVFASINHNMPRETYKHYIKTGLYKMLENRDKKEIKTMLSVLKFKFAPFHFIEEDLEKKMLIDAISKSYKDLSTEDVEEVLQTSEDIISENIDILGTIGAIYLNYQDLLNMYSECESLDEICQDDFIIKDMYFYTRESIKEGKLETLSEYIEKPFFERYTKLLDENEKIYTKIVQYLSKNKQPIPDIIKKCVNLHKMSIDMLEEKSLILENEETSEIASKEYIDESIEEFFNFIDNLDINNIALKKLKQNLFYYIPCEISKKEILAMINASLTSLDCKNRVLSEVKILSIVNPEKFEELMQEIEDIELLEEF